MPSEILPSTAVSSYVVLCLAWLTLVWPLRYFFPRALSNHRLYLCADIAVKPRNCSGSLQPLQLFERANTLLREMETLRQQADCAAAATATAVESRGESTDEMTESSCPQDSVYVVFPGHPQHPGDVAAGDAGAARWARSGTDSGDASSAQAGEGDAVSRANVAPSVSKAGTGLEDESSEARQVEALGRREGSDESQGAGGAGAESLARTDGNGGGSSDAPMLSLSKYVVL